MTPREVAVTGADGQLGSAIVAALREAEVPVRPLARGTFDIQNPTDLARLERWRPDVVVNCAAWTDVDGCARDPERAMEVNGHAAGAVARSAAKVGALSVQISTNEVFDGESEVAYGEDDAPNPINAYGSSKLLGEQLVVTENSRHLIVRTAWLFGPGGTNFVTKIIAAARAVAEAERPLSVVDDEFGNPTWTPSLSRRLVSTLSQVDPGTGVIHLAGQPSVSRYGWAEACIAVSGMAVALTPVTTSAYVRPSRPPRKAVLSTARSEALGLAPMDWRHPCESYVRDIVG